MITAKADNRKRVLIPEAKPGQIFEVVAEGGGNFRLALVQPSEPAKIHGRVTRRGKRLVGVTDRPIDMAALKEALADLP